MMDVSALDNPAWSALSGRHARLAVGEGPVLRYPAEVSPFAALETPAGLPILADRMTEGDTAVLWSPEALEAPEGLELVIRFPCLQMAAFDFQPAAVEGDVIELTAKDADAMISLTTLTKPGPFGARTIEMGRYIGLFAGEKLIAMAGERMKPEGFTEISAICVHPDHQGQGHARRLTSIMGKHVLEKGRMPFLNVLPENSGAIGLYQSLGFIPRRMMQVHLLRKPGGNTAPDAFFSSL